MHETVIMCMYVNQKKKKKPEQQTSKHKTYYTDYRNINRQKSNRYNYAQLFMNVHILKFIHATSVVWSVFFLYTGLFFSVRAQFNPTD